MVCNYQRDDCVHNRLSSDITSSTTYGVECTRMLRIWCLLQQLNIAHQIVPHKEPDGKIISANLLDDII